ncbi:MAG TPA: hypothetical protein IAC20_03780 [Candidatus Faecisoma merdavium]|nr:hypothetical protein [Candidatus Faecisoma merdavium]
MIEKMKSRKFLITLLTNIIAIATLFSNNNNEIIKLIALSVIAVANIAYEFVEGMIDAKEIEVKKNIDEK